MEKGSSKSLSHVWPLFRDFLGLFYAELRWNRPKTKKAGFLFDQMQGKGVLTNLRLNESCRIDGSGGPHIGLGPAERAWIVLLENPRVDAFFVKGVGAGQDPQLSSFFIIHKANWTAFIFISSSFGGCKVPFMKNIHNSWFNYTSESQPSKN